MIYPTIYIGGESRFELPAALSDFSDDLTLGWVNEVRRGRGDCCDKYHGLLVQSAPLGF
jgi:hypothetical protein